MRVVVLGAGLVGGPMAVDLSRDDRFEVTSVDRCESTLAKLAGANPSVKTLREDLSDPDKLTETIKGAELVVNNELKGLGNYDTTDKLQAEFGDSISCITIGQAGEMRLAGANIAVSDEEGRPARHAGRGGLGAVMGSKGLKAIVIEKEGGQRPGSADREAFTKAAQRFAQLLTEHEVAGQTLPTYGTNALANVINDAGLYPTRNFQEGQFELIDNVSGETQREIACRPGLR